MSRVRFEGVVKEYGKVTALHPLDLDIRHGEFLTLLGPSGCGKTTTLRLIAGLISPTRGRLYLDNDEVARLEPDRRNIGMVFQDYALFPHMTVEDNVAFGLVERGGFSAKEIRARVHQLLDLVGLPGVAGRYPAQLSGGQQQRIAVARAVAHSPRVLLLDEPLGALDLKLRESMQVELRRIQQELRITTVSVTHDQVEAMNISDRIAVMNHGRLEQIGTAAEIYDRPAIKFVADFVGQINFLPARIVGREQEWAIVETLGARLRVRGDTVKTTDGEVTFAIRPERLRIVDHQGGIPGLDRLQGRIADIRFVGNRSLVSVRVGDTQQMVVEIGRGKALGAIGDGALIEWDPRDALALAG
jgi:ABC-type Fe3+/spermidine/putrescine transport system ATPase subunit